MIPATTGVVNVFNGFYRSFCFWKEPWFSVRGHVMSVIFLILGAWSIQIAYVGRVSRKKGTRGENMRVDNDCNQPKSNELTPAGEYNDDTITQWSGCYTGSSGKGGVVASQPSPNASLCNVEYSDRNTLIHAQISTLLWLKWYNIIHLLHSLATHTKVMIGKYLYLKNTWARNR